MNNLLFTLALCVPALAQADWHRGHDDDDHGYHHRPRPVRQCVSSQTYVTGSSTEVSSGCGIRAPLRLTEKQAYFPNLRGNYFQVQYWDGTYGYTLNHITNYQTVVVNNCTGETLSNDSSSSVSTEEKEFSVENPNLDPGIKLSFELSPMTGEEANAVFGKLLDTCNTAISK
ncbi:MAG: hypothetical protein ACXWQO_03370 [Bdellovibrionota bacterium]